MAMLENQPEDDVILKVHVSLETPGGERIMEVRTEQLVPDINGEFALPSAEAAVRMALETQVMSPARGLVRSYVNKLREQKTYRRTDPIQWSPTTWPNDSETIAALNARIDTMAADEDGHAAAR